MNFKLQTRYVIYFYTFRIKRGIILDAYVEGL